MTRQHPYGWPQPPRVPLHASLGSQTPLRRQGRRALRLFIAAGIGAASLCLVIASVALVASADGTTTVTSASHQSAASGPRPQMAVRPGGAGLSAVRGTAILALASRGTKTTQPFTIGGTGTWELDWSYHDCTGAGGKGDFVVKETGTVPGASLSESGTAGRGAALAYRDKGLHRLVIQTRCAWTIAVLGHR